MPSPHLTLLLLALLPLTLSQNNDQGRLGTLYTGLPIYRSPTPSSASPSLTYNLLSEGLGTPIQGGLNLSLTTAIQYVMVAMEENCGGCVDGAVVYDPAKSGSYVQDANTATTNTFYNPNSISSSALTNVTGTLFSDLISDSRQDSIKREMLMLQDLGGDVLPTGISGYFGLSINPTNASLSIIPQIQASSGESSFTVGFSMNNGSAVGDGQQAGVMDWGAAVQGEYNGDFVWVKPRVNATASFWVMNVDGMNAVKTGIETMNIYATIDPSYNAIYLPQTTATAIYSKITGSVTDSKFPGRYIIPCDTAFDFSITIGGRKWYIPDSELVTPRSGQTCYGTIMAWGSGSVPGDLGTVILGTPFMSQVYSVLYYNPSQSYVGIAGKPFSANDGSTQPAQHLSGSAVGGILAGVLVALIALLLCVYVQKRDSWEGMHHRMLRHQQKIVDAQMKMNQPVLIPIAPGFPPQVISIAEPRHSEIYAPPYQPGALKAAEHLIGVQTGTVPIYSDDGAPLPVPGTDPREGRGFFGGWKNALNTRKWRNHERDVERFEREEREVMMREEERAQRHQERAMREHEHAVVEREERRRARREKRREERRQSGGGHHHHHHHHRPHHDHHEPGETPETATTPEMAQLGAMGATYGNPGYPVGMAMGMQGLPGYPAGGMGLGMPMMGGGGMMPGGGMGMGMAPGMGMPGMGMNQFGEMGGGVGPMGMGGMGPGMGGMGEMGMGMGVGGGQSMPYGYNQLPGGNYGQDEGYFGPQQYRGSFGGPGGSFDQSGGGYSGNGYGYDQGQGQMYGSRKRTWLDRLRGR